jgi:hypothetical protein
LQRGQPQASGNPCTAKGEHRNFLNKRPGTIIPNFLKIVDNHLFLSSKQLLSTDKNMFICTYWLRLDEFPKGYNILFRIYNFHATLPGRRFIN